MSEEEKVKQDRSGWRKRGAEGPWAHLDEETRMRYEAIQARVLEKWKRGELG